jgi:hypothetical protein
MKAKQPAKFEMDTDVIEVIAKPVPVALRELEETAPALVKTIAPIIAPEKRIDAAANKKDAEVHIKETLNVLQQALGELSELAPASQKASFYQTLSMVAKELIAGAITLSELKDEATAQEAKPTKTVNNLNVTLTSGQLNDIFKKSRTGKD